MGNPRAPTMPRTWFSGKLVGTVGWWLHFARAFFSGKIEPPRDAEYIWGNERARARRIGGSSTPIACTASSSAGDFCL